MISTFGLHTANAQYKCTVDTSIGRAFNALEDSLIHPFDDTEHIRPMDTLYAVPQNIRYVNGHIEFTIDIILEKKIHEYVIITLTTMEYELLIIWKQSHI